MLVHWIISTPNILGIHFSHQDVPGDMPRHLSGYKLTKVESTLKHANKLKLGNFNAFEYLRNKYLYNRLSIKYSGKLIGISYTVATASCAGQYHQVQYKIPSTCIWPGFFLGILVSLATSLPLTCLHGKPTAFLCLLLSWPYLVQNEQVVGMQFCKSTVGNVSVSFITVCSCSLFTWLWSFEILYCILFEYYMVIYNVI